MANNEVTVLEALRQDLAQMSSNIAELLLEVGGLKKKLDQALAQDAEPVERVQVGLAALRHEIATSATQVQGHQELMERYYRKLQDDFKRAMVEFVNQAQGINAETGELVASLHIENRELRELLAQMVTRLGMEESLAVVRQVQFPATVKCDGA